MNLWLLVAMLASLLVSITSLIPASWIHFSVECTILAHQLPIVPYVVISLLIGIGSLKPKRAVVLLKKMTWVLLFIWVFSLGMLFSMAYIFSLIPAKPLIWMPMPESAHAMQTSPAWMISMLFLLISSSIGLMHLPDKHLLLQPLGIIKKVIEAIFDMLLTLLPLSLFFLLTHALMGLSWAHVSHASVYLMACLIFCGFFVLWFYPWALYVFTRMSYQRIWKDIFPCLWLSFLAGDCAIALPLMLNMLRRLLHEIEDPDEELGQVLIPIAFAVPMAGSVGNLLFLFFASLMYGIPFAWLEYGMIGLLGPVTMFSEPVISVPTLLTWLNFSKDSVPVYMLLAVLTDPIFDAAEAFSIIFVCYMVLYALTHPQCFSSKNLLRFAIPTSMVMMLCAVSLYFLI